jgi:hypothetical protein
MRPITLLTVIFALFVTLTASAASVRQFGKNAVIIEGDIVHGDYGRLVAVLDKNRGGIDRVSIFSSGGSVFEAMKIGTLIRDLRLRTVAPNRFGMGGNTCFGIANQKNCTCLSACVLIFAGGVHHYGNVLGVHRSYVGNDFHKYMTGNHGINANQQLSYTVSDYLQKMGFPQSFIDTMNATKSQDIRYLNEVEIRKFLTGYAPKFNELVSAKCGNGKDNQRSYERLDKKRRATGLSPAERQQHSGLLTATTKRFPQCQQAVEAGWRKEVFDLVMQEARKNAANPRKGFW